MTAIAPTPAPNAAAAAPAPAADAAPVARPSWQGENAGQIQYKEKTLTRIFDGKDLMMMQVGSPIGDTHGYASFEDAVKGLAPLTVGVQPAAVVMRDAPGQPYYGHALIGTWIGNSGSWLGDKIVDNDYQITDLHTGQELGYQGVQAANHDIVGLVDGDFNTHFNPEQSADLDHPAQQPE
jgi:hypothetical protein